MLGTLQRDTDTYNFNKLSWLIVTMADWVLWKNLSEISLIMMLLHMLGMSHYRVMAYD